MGEREAGGKGAKGRENLGRKGEKDKEGLASVYHYLCIYVGCVTRYRRESRVFNVCNTFCSYL